MLIQDVTCKGSGRCYYCISRVRKFPKVLSWFAFGRSNRSLQMAESCQKPPEDFRHLSCSVLLTNSKKLGMANSSVELVAAELAYKDFSGP
jgi:hypothetical protein